MTETRKPDTTGMHKMTGKEFLIFFYLDDKADLTDLEFKGAHKPPHGTLISGLIYREDMNKPAQYISIGEKDAGSGIFSLADLRHARLWINNDSIVHVAVAADSTYLQIETDDMQRPIHLKVFARFTSEFE